MGTTLKEGSRFGAAEAAGEVEEEIGGHIVGKEGVNHGGAHGVIGSSFILYAYARNPSAGYADAPAPKLPWSSRETISYGERKSVC